MPTKTIRIATRTSPLAIWQAEHVARELHAIHSDLNIELVKMVTQGDRILDTSLSKVGGKGLFVKELEHGMLNDQADIAVHSMKDVPVQIPDGLCMQVIMQRENPHDAFVSNHYQNLAELPKNARVGTSSLRRASQIKVRYPGLEILDCRGNVNTRLKKLDDNQYDAIILAVAGLKRLGMNERIAGQLSIEESLPAIGQGAIGIECRDDDQELHQLLHRLNHAPTAVCVSAERTMNARLGGSCSVPIAGHAIIEKDEVYLQGLIAAPDGSAIYVAEASGIEPEQTGLAVAEGLLEQGAGKVLQALGLPGV